MKKICITGGAGFIGSHLVDYLASKYPQAHLVVVDKMCYPARREYLEPLLRSRRATLVEGSICNSELMNTVLAGADLVIHAAAESHVDNSYRDVKPFIETNIMGTISVLAAARQNNVGLFVHVSTDEVYGESECRNLTVNDKLNPTNPYAASKAAAEMFVLSYARSYRMRTRITRANNIFGTRQYPEKLIPKLICDALLGNTFVVHGRGTAFRAFLEVSDFCQAVGAIIDHGEDGGVYNVPAQKEYSVMAVVEMVSKALGIDVEKFVAFGPDRPHNDCRYGVKGEQLSALGWKPTRLLENELSALVDWYKANLELYSASQQKDKGAQQRINRTLKLISGKGVQFNRLRNSRSNSNLYQFNPQFPSP
ncbi:GDP-mannose 4,6-dehydratase [Ruegeria marina]|uniref:UDP-glucose 4,6-dehydratase n=1 Tax=Ruegeria marina TaxID=639004 RepID=A0A1G6VLE4_9RHOB|nr:GDP-mannose 4,6-dehydratase [Ruegeria marina]SDD54450.1 UDP-glucose 4,6-dehydratase [Ruegeria marina]